MLIDGTNGDVVRKHNPVNIKSSARKKHRNMQTIEVKDHQEFLKVKTLIFKKYKELKGHNDIYKPVYTFCECV